jgi:hypothetical protein
VREGKRDREAEAERKERERERERERDKEHSNLTGQGWRAEHMYDELMSHSSDTSARTTTDRHYQELGRLRGVTIVLQEHEEARFAPVRQIPVDQVQISEGTPGTDWEALGRARTAKQVGTVAECRSNPPGHLLYR